jgi:cytoskeleton protein RodZ
MEENFGSYLKKERELRGVPLEEISGATKIHIRFLKALEENKFEELPGEVFIKGYIRSYANIIGSDVEEVLNNYKECVGNNNIENRSDSVTPSNTSAKIFLGFALIGLIVLALIFGVRFLMSSKNNPPVINVVLDEKKSLKPSAELPIKVLEEKTPLIIEDKLLKKSDLPALEQTQTVTTELNSPDEKPGEKKPELESQVNNLAPTEKENPKVLEKPLKLIIKTKNNSWFNMTIDDFREEDFILPADGEKSYLANNVFRLTIGNKQGTEIILNGKQLVIPESKKNVVKDFIITSKLIE